MFYKALYNFLRTDPAISAVVSSYEGSPAIFSVTAPEDAERPYITFRISSIKLPDSVIVSNLVDIDYWDSGTSRVQADAAAIAIEDRLDTILLRADTLTDIRFSMSSADHVPSEYPLDIHHNTTFDARGARIGWMKRTL